MKKPHIVIVGAGFGGVYTAKHLLPYTEKDLINVTIINRTNYFLFTPLLHEVATGGLRPTSISESLREVFKDTRVTVYQTEVTSVDIQKKEISLGSETIQYDYLVVATGATTSYYGIAGAEENTLPLKNLSDAVRIREQIINSFEKATLSHDDAKRKKLLSFAVVGGGATGVETVTELSELAMEIGDRYYSTSINGKKKCTLPKVTITLINATDEILKPFHPHIRKIAEDRLKKMGITVMLKKKVTSVGPGIINFENNESLSAETIIWTAGVTPSIPKFLEKNPALVTGRLQTNKYLMLENEKNVFVIGDSAGVVDGDQQTPPPMLAQVAVSQAKILAHNIIATIMIAPLKPYTYKPKGSLVSLGQWYAAGEIFGLIIYGRLAWWIWRTVYLFKFTAWEKRIRIVFEWTTDIFYPRDITKLL